MQDDPKSSEPLAPEPPEPGLQPTVEQERERRKQALHALTHQASLIENDHPTLSQRADQFYQMRSGDEGAPPPRASKRLWIIGLITVTALIVVGGLATGALRSSLFTNHSPNAPVQLLPTATPLPTSVRLPASLEGQLVLVSSTSGSTSTLYALDGQTGVMRWHISLGTVQSAFLFSQGIVYVAPADGSLVAIRVSDGTQLWHIARSSASPGYLSVADGVVYVASGDGELTAVDAMTGAARWRYQVSVPGYFAAPPAVAPPFVYAASAGPSSQLVAIDTQTGAIHWHVPSHEVNKGQLAAYDGVVYVPTGDGIVTAYDASTGNVRWRYQTGGSSINGPVIANHDVYLTTDNALEAVDAVTGKALWSAPAPTFDSLSTAPAVVGGVAYAGSADGYLYAFDIAQGTLLWRHQVDSGVTSAPAIINGALFYGTSQGTVGALISTTGAGAWRFTLDGPAASAPVLLAPAP